MGSMGSITHTFTIYRCCPRTTEVAGGRRPLGGQELCQKMETFACVQRLIKEEALEFPFF